MILVPREKENVAVSNDLKTAYRRRRQGCLSFFLLLFVCVIPHF